MNNLDAIADVFARAKCPEDVFGLVGKGTPEERRHIVLGLYRKIVMAVHPDKHADTPNFDRASKLFSELTDWKNKADAKLDAGTYGDGKAHEPAPTKPTMHAQVIKTPKREYIVTEPLASGDLADLYRCTYTDKADTKKEHHAVFKLARSAADNDLLENESKVLASLYPAEQVEEKFFRFLPKPLDSFMLRDEGSPRTPAQNRRVNVLQLVEGHYTLAEVMKAYPKGLDFRDIVWMFKRCLMGLGYVHRQGVVHGAILPTHVLIHPTGHGAKIVDWCYAVPGEVTRCASKRGPVKAISKAYRDYYPPEVFAKKPATAQTDLYMLSKCVVALLGGDVTTKQMPDSVPAPIRAFFSSCLIEAQGRRPDDAWALHEEFDELLQRLVGRPRYRPLTMPAR